MTDRRSTIRFEIVGRLRGSLATAQPARLLDLSWGGASVEMEFPLSVDSHHAVQIGITGQQHISTVEVRVRHVRPAIELGRYVIGFEFLGPAQVVEELLGSGAEQERA